MQIANLEWGGVIGAKKYQNNAKHIIFFWDGQSSLHEPSPICAYVETQFYARTFLIATGFISRTKESNAGEGLVSATEVVKPILSKCETVLTEIRLVVLNMVYFLLLQENLPNNHFVHSAL